MPGLKGQTREEHRDGPGVVLFSRETKPVLIPLPVFNEHHSLEYALDD